MRLTAKTLFQSAAAAGAICALALSAMAGMPAPNATADLKNLEGTSVGTAQLTQTPHGVLVYVKVRDLPPGAKGIHLHAKADCAADTGFKSSLGHHGEAKGQHGLLNAQGPGKGDLGNIFIAETGIGEMQFFKAGAFLTDGDLPLLDEDGTAIVIHANMDDQVTQPIGGAGPRIVCGLIQAN